MPRKKKEEIVEETPVKKPRTRKKKVEADNVQPEENPKKKTTRTRKKKEEVVTPETVTEETKVEEHAEEDVVVAINQNSNILVEEDMIQEDEEKKEPDEIEAHLLKQTKDNIGKLWNYALIAILSLSLIFAMANVFMNKKSVVLPDSESVSVHIPKNWYISEDNLLYELKDNMLTLKAAYQVYTEISEEEKESFFNDVKTYYESLDTDNPNIVVMIDKTGSAPVYSMFRYIPGKSSVIEIDYQDDLFEQAMAIAESAK